MSGTTKSYLSVGLASRRQKRCFRDIIFTYFLMSIDELKALLASSNVLTFKGSSREKIYAWIQSTLRSYHYRSRPRSGKGVLRRYMRKITRISNSQLTRLIAQFRRSCHVRILPYQRDSFPTKYTREDQLLLAELDSNSKRRQLTKKNLPNAIPFLVLASERSNTLSRRLNRILPLLSMSARVRISV